MSPDSALLDFIPSQGRWPARGAREAERVRRALGPACHAVHHVGATSVPDLPAMPVLDLVAELVAEMASHAALRLLAHGFRAVPVDADCTLHVVEDPLTGPRHAEPSAPMSARRRTAQRPTTA